MFRWRKKQNKIKVTTAWRESEIAIIAFRLHRSEITPEIGVITICGINIKNTDIERITALPVSTVSHHVITKPTIIEPNNENC